MTLILLNNGPKHESSDAGNLDILLLSLFIDESLSRGCVYRKKHKTLRITNLGILVGGGKDQRNKMSG